MKILQASEGHAVRATDRIAHLDYAAIIDADIIPAAAKIGCASANDKRSAIVHNGLTVATAIEIEPACRRATIDINTHITRRVHNIHQVTLTYRRAAIEIDNHVATGAAHKNGTVKAREGAGVGDRLMPAANHKNGFARNDSATVGDGASRRRARDSSCDNAIAVIVVAGIAGGGEADVATVGDPDRTIIRDSLQSVQIATIAAAALSKHKICRIGDRCRKRAPHTQGGFARTPHLHLAFCASGLIVDDEIARHPSKSRARRVRTINLNAMIGAGGVGVHIGCQITDIDCGSSLNARIKHGFITKKFSKRDSTRHIGGCATTASQRHGTGIVNGSATAKAQLRPRPSEKQTSGTECH